MKRITITISEEDYKKLKECDSEGNVSRATRALIHARHEQVKKDWKEVEKRRK